MPFWEVNTSTEASEMLGQHTQAGFLQPVYALNVNLSLIVRSGRLVALATIYRSILSRLKRHFGFIAALSAYYREHLTWSPVIAISVTLRFPCSAAIGTAPRLIL